MTTIPKRYRQTDKRTYVRTDRQFTTAMPRICVWRGNNSSSCDVRVSLIAAKSTFDCVVRESIGLVPVAVTLRFLRVFLQHLFVI